ncbi:MAG: hypothetical protein KAH18_12775, partial [Psychromonas sp.]|nr:hypothetical protein [Psychromonas sp.]
FISTRLGTNCLALRTQAQKPRLRYNNRKVNNNYLILCLVLIIDLEPDKAFLRHMGIVHFK